MQPVPQRRLPLDRPEVLPQLKQVLVEAGYSDKNIARYLGAMEMPVARENNLPRLLQQTSKGTRLDTLLRLFLYGIDVPREAAEAAVAPVPLETWASAGLLEVRGDSVSPSLTIFPFQHLLLVHDIRERAVATEEAETVLGLVESSLDVLRFTVRHQVGRTLDLGCGFGIQSFLAAMHSDHVVGVDLNARALAFAEFNAQLNSIRNVEFRHGNSFAPVEGETFDLIVSNPPYVIKPGVRFLFRDSGHAADGFCQSLLQNAPQYLNEGGVCQLICDWVHLKGQDPIERVKSWFKNSQCDVWILKMQTTPANTYAGEWIAQTEDPQAEQFPLMYREWLQYYEEQGIEAMTLGLIAVRKRTAPAHWFVIEDAPEELAEPFGREVDQRLALQDYLNGLPDDRALLDRKLRVSHSVRLTQESDWVDGRWQPRAGQIRLAGGLKHQGNVDQVSIRLLSGCTGEHTLGELIQRIAQEFRADPERIIPGCLPLVKGLIARGFVLPAEMKDLPLLGGTGK